MVAGPLVRNDGAWRDIVKRVPGRTYRCAVERVPAGACAPGPGVARAALEFTTGPVAELVQNNGIPGQ